jgi:hypothetical protein
LVIRGFDIVDQDAVGMAQESTDGALMLRFMGVIGVFEAMTRYMKQRKRTSVFISRGIGWAMYPVRFNCLQEIAVLEFVYISMED